jgi:glycosyltransferase involved in cell wall biosynthesis
MFSPIVSVIIPTYHDWDSLKLCLDSLKKQTYPQENFEVLVINNDPNDFPPYKVESGNVKLLQEFSPGSYIARNLGIFHAKGKIIAFTDSDCIPLSTWLSNAVNRFKSEPSSENSIFAGQINVFPKQRNNPNIIEIFSMNFELNQEKYVKKKRFATANVFIKKIFFEMVGNFNGSLKSNGDFEFASRAVKRNIDIKYCKNCQVDHPARFRFKQILIKAKRKIGGAYDTAIILKTPIIKLFLSIMKLSFLSIFEILNSNNKFYNKLKLLIVLIIYQGIKLIELIKLIILTKKSERR